MKVNIFITVDTEHSIGGAFQNPKLKPVGNDRRIFGRKGNKEYGIPLIMDIADRYGIPLTFFVEVLNKYYFGENESREVCRYIIDRGHDVQLHLHPNYLNFTLPNPRQIKFSDLIGSYGLEKQIEILEDGKSILVKNGLAEPIAFRAGCFGVNSDTLKALKKCGFLIDSSYNAAYLGGPCLLKDKKINDLTDFEGIWEFPVTNFLEPGLFGMERFKPMDVNGVSFPAMQEVLKKAVTAGPRNVTIILHSFSFLMPFDLQYKRVKPRFRVIRWFDKLCAFLKNNENIFNPITFGSLSEKDLSDLTLHTSNYFHSVGPLSGLVRTGEYLLDIFSIGDIERYQIKS